MKKYNRPIRKHYNFGDLMAFGKQTENGCIEWQKLRNPDGYGQLWVQGKFVGVHRWSLYLITGEMPAGLSALHSCHNRACFNPDHLRWGTQKENMQDRKERNTTYKPIGNLNPNAVLNPDLVRIIRALYAYGYKPRPIAEFLKIDDATVSHVCMNRTWKHIV